MRVLEGISNFVSKYMAIIVLAVAALALFRPGTLNWIAPSWINYLLIVVMFGMGLAMKPSDFAVVFTRPKEVIIGVCCQFIIMPLLAIAIGTVFQLDNELLVGLVLVGTCPGGTSSNVISFLSKADVALSVGMTSVSTLLAPVLTPAITLLLLGQNVEVNFMSMFISIIKVVIVPIGLGFILTHYFSNFTQKIVNILPLISVTAIMMIVASVVAANSAKILTTGLLIFACVILHNLFGYILGFGVASVFRLPLKKKKTLAIEVGMQNSGLASSLALSAFPNLAMATVPGACFSVWHNISGAILANIFLRMKDPKEKEENQAKEVKQYT